MARARLVDELMREIQDKSSPRCHKWLTPEEMHTKYASSQAQFNEVEQWLVSQGFTITDKEPTGRTRTI